MAEGDEMEALLRVAVANAEPAAPPRLEQEEHGIKPEL